MLVSLVTLLLIATFTCFTLWLIIQAPGLPRWFRVICVCILEITVLFLGCYLISLERGIALGKQEILWMK